MLNGDKHFTRGAAAGQVRSEVAALVLAAGQSLRFGGAKLLIRFRGRPLASHAFETVASARKSGLVVAPAAVVVAADDESLASLARDAGLRVLRNDAPAAGLGRSLRLGLDHLAETEAGAALILLADQPLVRLDVLQALVGAWRRSKFSVVRPSYADDPGTPGHPVLLDRSVWSLRDRLTGDAGLGPLLDGMTPPPETIMVPGRNPDIDTPADLPPLEDS